MFELAKTNFQDCFRAPLSKFLVGIATRAFSCQDRSICREQAKSVGTERGGGERDESRPPGSNPFPESAHFSRKHSQGGGGGDMENGAGGCFCGGLPSRAWPASGLPPTSPPLLSPPRSCRICLLHIPFGKEGVFSLLDYYYSIMLLRVNNY